MKKLALVFVVALGFTSCDNVKITTPDQTSDQPSKSFRQASEAGGTITLRLTEFDGHTYVIMDGYKQGGICHAESCACKSK